jgi:hypothetical protein
VLEFVKEEGISKLKILVLSLGLITANSVYAYDDGDFQVWHTDAQEIKMNQEWKLAFEEEFRWGDNAADFYYHHYDAVFIYGINKYLDVGAGYRRIFSKAKGKFRAEDEPYISATLSGGLAGFKFDDRSRLEYQYFDYQDDSWRYRNKLVVKLPWKFTQLEIQPFISDEIFLRFDDSTNLNQNRLASGLGLTLARNIKAEVYYMLVSTKSAGKWTDVNVLGTKLKILF